MNGYSLGCIRDPQDDRDLLLANYIIPKKLPKSINWFNMSIPVLNQGNQPACVGYSSVGMKEEQEMLEINKVINFSGLDFYKRLKELDGMPNEQGTFIRVAMKTLQEEGIKDIDKNVYKIESYASVKSIDELKYAITANGFAVIGISVFDSFYSPENGIIDYKEGEKNNGLHAIILGSYDDNVEKFILKNSWGIDWGLGGYSYITYKYIEKALNDAWTSVDLENPKSVATSLFDVTRLKRDLIDIKKTNK
jgi:hypothetical protein